MVTKTGVRFQVSGFRCHGVRKVHGWGDMPPKFGSATALFENPDKNAFYEKGVVPDP
jgi:hypothetical protein